MEMLLLMGLVPFLVFTIITVINFFDSETALYRFTGTIAIILLLVLVSVFAAYANTNWISKVRVVKSTTVENIDTIVADGRPVNLNERFKRDFEDGTEFEVTEYGKTYCNGFFASICDDTIKLKESDR